MIRKFFLYLAALAGLVVAAFLAYQGYVLLRLWWWTDHNPASTAFMDARLQALREKNPNARLQQQWVPYEKISSHLKRAILVAEDDKFETSNTSQIGQSAIGQLGSADGQ